MTGLADANIRVAIAFSLVIIMWLLAYIAFFKNPLTSAKKSSNRK